MILTASMLTSTSLLANDNIKYDWVELDLGFSSTSFSDQYSAIISSSFSLSDRFYVTMDASRGIRDYNWRDNKSAMNEYSLSLGFHTAMGEKTDFYSELGLGRLDEENKYYSQFTNDYVYFNVKQNFAQLKLGTRTAFTEKFELITNITFKDDYLHTIDLGVKGVYKFNKKSSLTFGRDTSDNKGDVFIGWRYNWK